MWQGSWREEAWSQVKEPFDILVIGGGITGAGIFREAVRLGLRVLLVEQRDFAWGTSSRSSKLVHGGLRYLGKGQLGLTIASVQERQQLMAEGPGLVDPLGFLLTIYKGDIPGRISYGVGLTIYDLLALQWEHRYYSPAEFQMLAPHIARQNLKGGFRCVDAQTDDARLVLRVIKEAVAGGGLALNYVTAEELLWTHEEDGGEARVTGARLRDGTSGQEIEVHASVVINATGAWADRLRRQVGGEAHIRPLRGSHLIFSQWRLPAAQAISFLHPVDHRPVFIFPWESVTLVGTTDVDHTDAMEHEPGISPEEVSYLMAALEHEFPSLGITLKDILSTYSGVRPVLGTGKANPSEESREHIIWQENGLLTVTGGKMTTFRLIAHDALKAARGLLPSIPPVDPDQPVLDRVEMDLAFADGLDLQDRRRLLGRYGREAVELIQAAHPGELKQIPGTKVLWAELRWAAHSEGVIHLEDLLLRRVRIGLMLPGGGEGILPAVRAICQDELGWDHARWESEQVAYLKLWRQSYSLPDPNLIPDWKADIAQAQRRRQAKAAEKTVAWRQLSIVAALLAGAAAVLGMVIWRRQASKHGSENQGDLR